MTPGSRQRTIEITVSPTGKTKLETRGFTGPSCREVSRDIERALGLVESDRPTAELHQSQSGQQQLDQQHGG